MTWKKEIDSHTSQIGEMFLCLRIGIEDIQRLCQGDQFVAQRIFHGLDAGDADAKVEDGWFTIQPGMLGNSEQVRGTIVSYLDTIRISVNERKADE